MARILPRPAEGSGLFLRFAYWMARRRLGRVPVPVGIMGHDPWVLAAVGGFEMAFERAGAADTRRKELASVKVATVIGCRFCIDIGSSLARGHGVTEDELRDLLVYETSAHFDAVDKQVLDYAVAMSQTPMSVPMDLFHSLERAMGTPALVELTAAIAWENFRARFNHAFGATEEGFPGGMVCLLPPATVTADASLSP